MKRQKLNLLIITGLLLIVSLACSLKADNEPEPQSSIETAVKKEIAEPAQKLESYEIKGLKFAYYKIKANLSREDLINTARKIHEQEADTNLILVDDDSKIADYISYVKAISAGDTNKEMPKEWAEKHIVANVQNYLNGRWVLCKGYGFNEIADLK